MDFQAPSEPVPAPASPVGAVCAVSTVGAVGAVGAAVPTVTLVRRLKEAETWRGGPLGSWRGVGMKSVRDFL